MTPTPRSIFDRTIGCWFVTQPMEHTMPRLTRNELIALNADLAAQNAALRTQLEDLRAKQHRTPLDVPRTLTPALYVAWKALSASH